MRRCLLFAIMAGVWLTSAALAEERVPTVFSSDCPQPAPAACAPGGDLIPWLPSGDDGASDPAGRFWASAEFLAWHANGYNTPPLITTSPAGAPQSIGALASGATVAGGRKLNEDFFPGLRVGAGLWLDD